MPKTESFETHAERYDAWFDTHRPAFESELNAVRRLLPKHGVGVEIGVGTGRFAEKAALYRAGFRELKAVQTIFDEPEEMIQVDPVRPG